MKLPQCLGTSWLFVTELKSLGLIMNEWVNSRSWLLLWVHLGLVLREEFYVSLNNI